uniref:B box-type domain-containing protein n=1 Tax=Acanthochromis polyacanthus TaxID=80966 RepID=A0A3Q1EU33_9TELE
MAQAAILLDEEKLSCSICLELLNDPVTVPCGKIHSCPQCRQQFTTMPVLMKSTMLAKLMEELKKAGLLDASPDHSYAGPEDVACDFCDGRKQKAFKSCLTCMASYCELHLQPHFSMAPLKKHKLIDATSKLQENICPCHDKVMKIFCRTDRQCICYLCAMDEHKGHVTVSAAAERAERQKELGDREKNVKVLQERFEAIGVSADKAVSDCDKVFTDLIYLIEKKSSEVKQMIRSQQKTDESQIKEQHDKLLQEITELRRKDAEREKLSSTEDHLHFLNSYHSLTHLSETTQSPSSHDFTVQYYEKMTAAVSEARDTLKPLLSDQWLKISVTGTKEKVVLAPKDFVRKRRVPPKETSIPLLQILSNF